MPYGDGTGPLGTGPIGWGLGPCGRRGARRRGGRSFGGGRGRAGFFGWERADYYGGEVPYVSDKETINDEIQVLKDRIKGLEEIRDRIPEDKQG